jgi:threonine/homoserine efflux transporter RhtA
LHPARKRLRWREVSALAMRVEDVYATLLRYGLWSRLLSHYPASQVAPFSLLVPIVGLASASIFLYEHLSAAQVVSAVLVIDLLKECVFKVRKQCIRLLRTNACMRL